MWSRSMIAELILEVLDLARDLGTLSDVSRKNVGLGHWLTPVRSPSQQACCASL